MRNVLERYWWMLTVRGLFGVFFGLLALTRPGAALMTLLYVFGAFLIADGIMTLAFGTRDYGAGRRWWMFIVHGVATLAAGILTIVAPGVAAVGLLIWIAFWAIATGAAEIYEAVALRRVIEHEWLLGLAGIASIGFGALLLARPVLGAISIVWLLGGFSLVFGGLIFGLGLEGRRLSRKALH